MKKRFYLLWFVFVIFSPILKPPVSAIVKFGILSSFVATAAAESYVVDVKERYPSDAYIIGIAEVQSSGDVYRDRRRSEVLARLEIAKQIRVVIKEKTIDVMCEGGVKVLFDNQTECQNQIIMVVEESVEEVLEGSRIVDTGEDKVKGIYYAVVILPRKEAASKAEEGYKESIELVRQYLVRARVSKDEETRKEQVKKAKEELIKSMAYVGESSALDKARDVAEDMFKELAEEITKIEAEER